MRYEKGREEACSTGGSRVGTKEGRTRPKDYILRPDSPLNHWGGESKRRVIHGRVPLIAHGLEPQLCISTAMVASSPLLAEPFG